MTPTPTPTLCPDIYEPDDDWQHSSMIGIGESQDHSFHIAGDVDYVKFVAQPLTYTIWTTRTYGFDIDTTLTLYDTDGTTQLDYNDNDWANPPLSRITYHFATTGTYFIKVAHFNPDAGGCGPDLWYTLVITPTSSSPSMPLDEAHLASNSKTMYRRESVFLPLYWKDWDRLRRFRH